MTLVSECERLGGRLQRMEGLLDVKFLLGNTDDATLEAVCGEVNSLLDAVDRGEDTPYKFDASRH